MKKINFKKLILKTGLFYLALLAFLFLFQRDLQYHPMGKIKDLNSYNLTNFSEEILTTKDNLKILSWYKKPSGNNQKTILYFHGNAGNLGERSAKLKVFADAGFGVLAISYQGYFGSEGHPSESGLINNGLAAVEFLYKQGFKPEEIILFGESLGSGVAVQIAQTGNFHAVILESPYSSIASVAQKKYWFAPVALMLKDKFESVKYAPDILAPVLIFHGTKDSVVPYQEGEELFAAFNSRKKLVTVEGVGHLDFSDQFLLDEMRQFLQPF